MPRFLVTSCFGRGRACGLAGETHAKAKGGGRGEDGNGVSPVALAPRGGGLGL